MTPLAFALALAATPPAISADPYAPGKAVVAELNRIVTRRGVDETFVATLGGARQVVNVRGADRGNPILLFVHGGPGAVEMPIAWSFQRPWEDLFTVAHYDQRGAGRSFGLEEPAVIAPTLSVDRYRDDAIALIELLRARYGKRRVVLMGHSWGSVIGMAVAAQRPDLLHAYVGVGQVIDFRENEARGYAWTLAEARQRGDAAAVRALEAIAPYPSATGPFDLAKLEIERTWNVRYGGLAAGRADADFYFRPARLSPLYTPADRAAWNAGSAFTMKAMFPQLSDVSFARVRRVRTPVLLFLGRQDWTTPSSIAAEWLARVRAPRRRAIWFENSAHLPMIEEPGRFFRALADEVLPLVREDRR